MNRILIGFCCFLVLLLVISGINHAKINRYEHVLADNEFIDMNLRCIPEIIRSYEKVKNIYGRKNILFFRYSNTSYSGYMDNWMDEISTLQKETGKESIWIFSAYPTDRNSRIRMNNELTGFNYRNIPADSLLIPTYKGKVKCYFAWINNEGDIEIVFIPDENRVQHTYRFFREVKKILQISENEE